VYLPDQSRADAYDALYAEYRLLHDYLGRGANDAMLRLRNIRNAAIRGAGGAA
jgi:L-ribulokinase